MESFENIEEAPYGFVIWPDGKVESVDRIGGHEDLINDSILEYINVDENEDHMLYFYFFKVGGVRMTRENDKYWIEADLSKASQKNIKTAKDIALSYKKQYEINRTRYTDFS